MTLVLVLDLALGALVLALGALVLALQLAEVKLKDSLQLVSIQVFLLLTEVGSVDSLQPLHMVANIQRWSIQKWNILKWSTQKWNTQKWKDFIQQCLATWER